MNHNINFLSLNNNLKVYEVDFQHKYISFEDEDSMNCFIWKGGVSFFTDGNGAGETWVGFNHNIEVVCVNLESLDYDEEQVIEHILQELYNAEYEDAMKGDYL